MKRSYITLLILYLSIALSAQENVTRQKRLALIIGNSAYEHSGVLKNPSNDAQLMASTLMDLGFDVIKCVDASKDEMDKAILDFWRKLSQYDITLFYYAGHGIQVEGRNYLLPVNAKIDDKYALQMEAIEVNKVVKQFERYPSNTNIVILDACRDNPFRSWMRSGGDGFAAMEAPSGSIIAFATSAGATASDGDGSNGLYTEKLTKQMMVPQRIEDVFIQTRNEVRNASNGRQNPQEWSQLTGRFYFTSGVEEIPGGSELDPGSSSPGYQETISSFTSNATELLFSTNKLKPHINAKEVSMNEALSYLRENDNDAYTQISKYYKRKRRANIIMWSGYAVGGLSLYLSSQDQASESVLVAGLVGSVGGICAYTIATISDSKLRKAKQSYNSNMESTVSLGLTQNGVALLCNF